MNKKWKSTCSVLLVCILMFAFSIRDRQICFGAWEQDFYHICMTNENCIINQKEKSISFISSNNLTEEKTVRILLKMSEIDENGNLIVEIVMENVKNLGGMDFSLLYDADVLSYVEGHLQGVFAEGLGEVHHVAEKHTLNVVSIYQNGINEDGQAVLLTFQLKGEKAKLPTLEVNDLVDASLEIKDIPFEVQYQQIEEETSTETEQGTEKEDIQNSEVKSEETIETETSEFINSEIQNSESESVENVNSEKETSNNETSNSEILNGNTSELLESENTEQISENNNGVTTEEGISSEIQQLFETEDVTELENKTESTEEETTTETITDATEVSGEGNNMIWIVGVVVVVIGLFVGVSVVKKNRGNLE